MGYTIFFLVNCILYLLIDKVIIEISIGNVFIYKITLLIGTYRYDAGLIA